VKKTHMAGIVSIALLVVLALSTPNLNANAGLFFSPVPPPPPNDDFDSATAIGGLPFSEWLDTGGATYAGDDPWDCTNNGSVWYAFTPSSDMAIEANTFDSDYDTVLSAYTGTRGALTLVPGACNDDYYGTQSRVSFPVTAGTTYYLLVGFCCGGGSDGGGNLHLTVQEISGPPNDNFADAVLVLGLPFAEDVNTESATVEEGEPMPSCSEDPMGRTVWYSFVPSESGSFSAYILDAWFSPAVAAYTGDSLADLTEIGSRCWGGPLTFRAEAGTTYHFQVRGVYNEGSPLRFYLQVTPPPQAEFWFYPGDPSVFEDVQFYDYSWDPGEVGIESQAWDFGDGTTATGCCPTHRYAADGDYTVQLAVTTVDGRQGSTSQTVSVHTHDVAITKFAVPQAAKAKQTRTIVVGISSKRYPERIQVEFYKSVPGGFEHVGTLTQSVPVRSGGLTTDFKFSYTFTPEDAAIGKVTFRAAAYIVDARDAFFADNEAIAAPTKVSR
jgi:PKD repeat protein